jgi:alpha-D-xyloside xylohydrolase
MQKDDLDEWRELNLRWYQFGAFCPLFRIHGQFPYREIYNISPEGHPVYKSMVFYDRLRYRLMPYIYTLQVDLALRLYHHASPGNGPCCRSGGAGYRGRIHVRTRSAGVRFTPTGRGHASIPPATCGWYDLLSGQYFEEGRPIQRRLPWRKCRYMPGGAILPMGPGNAVHR